MMYRIMVTLIILIIFSLRALAPGERVLYIEKAEPLTKYDRLIKAVVYVESRGDNHALNVTEQACGPFQIRKCRIDHYNRMTGAKYELSDCFDYDISKKVFLYFANGKSYAQAAMSWNGSGPMTKVYWGKVQKQLAKI